MHSSYAALLAPVADPVETEIDLIIGTISAVIARKGSNGLLPSDIFLCHPQLQNRQLNSVKRGLFDRNAIKMSKKETEIPIESSNIFKASKKMYDQYRNGGPYAFREYTQDRKVFDSILSGNSDDVDS